MSDPLRLQLKDFLGAAYGIERELGQATGELLPFPRKDDHKPRFSTSDALLTPPLAESIRSLASSRESYVRTTGAPPQNH